MKLKQVQEMNCGCSVTDGVITMCPMHEAGPELWKAAERLVEIFDESSAKMPDDGPDWERRQEVAREAHDYVIPGELIGAIWDIEVVLGGEAVVYKKPEESVAEKVPGENQNHQPKLS